MNFEEMAREVEHANEIKIIMTHAGIPVNAVTVVVIDSMRKAAFAAGREAMREEAANACEAKANRWGNSTNDAINNALMDAAAAIRALPRKEG